MDSTEGNTPEEDLEIIRRKAEFYDAMKLSLRSVLIDIVEARNLISGDTEDTDDGTPGRDFQEGVQILDGIITRGYPELLE